MFKKTNRLASSKDIAAAFARGRGFFNPLFTIRYLPTAAGRRFTVVVSTKVYKNAVSRNRLKRIVRECLKKHLPDLKSGDYIIMAKPKLRDFKEQDILNSFLGLLGKITSKRL